MFDLKSRQLRYSINVMKVEDSGSAKMSDEEAMGWCDMCKVKMKTENVIE